MNYRLSAKVYVYVIYFISLNINYLGALTFAVRPGGGNELNTCDSFYGYFSGVDFRRGFSLSEISPLNVICPGGDSLFSESEKLTIPFFFFIYIVTLLILLTKSVKVDISLLKIAENLPCKAKEILFYGETLYLVMPFVGIFLIMYTSFFWFDWGFYVFVFGLLSVPVAQILNLLNLLLNGKRDVCLQGGGAKDKLSKV